MSPCRALSLDRVDPRMSQERPVAAIVAPRRRTGNSMEEAAVLSAAGERSRRQQLEGERTLRPGRSGSTPTVWSVEVIDQRWLPHAFRVETLRNVGEAATAIRDMWVRGAPLIGVTAAYGVALAIRSDPSDANLDVGLGNAACDPAHGDQPALGARRRARPVCARRAGRGAPRRPMPRPPRSPTRTSPSTAPSAATGSADHPRDRGDEKARRAGQHPHPLQRRLARDRRLGHRDRADLPGAGAGHPGPCLGRRDPAAQPGRVADRLGVRQPRNVPHT